MPEGCVTPQQFAQFLDEQLPVYDSLIIRDIRPTDGFIGHVSVGQWDPFDATQHSRDRFRHVQPDLTKKWEAIANNGSGGQLSCEGSQCDPTENFICWGYNRITYFQERQSWRSQTLCFDQILTVNKAQEHIEQIVADILRPATSAVMSQYLRKRILDHAGKKWAATATMADFTFAWVNSGDSEYLLDSSQLPTSKLTPQMLQRRVADLRNLGYFGKWSNDPFFGGYDSMIELVTDDETAWELDKLVTDLKVSQSWRFNQEWTAAHDYYKYGIGGSLGNYMVRIDPFPLRFNYVGNVGGGTPYRFQTVLPYRNYTAAGGGAHAPTVGMGDYTNSDWPLAQYQMSIIHHRMALMVRVQRMEQVNALMPFAVRDLSGQWRFAINDLGADCNGNVIANYRQNKGFFYADFQPSVEPRYVEWEEVIFHKREPAVVTVVDTCASDPGHPQQYYNSACTLCGTTLTFTPQADGDGNFVLGASSVTCDDDIVANDAISSASLAALVIALNADSALGALGTWQAFGADLQLLSSACEDLALPWVV